ncbi:phosphoribosylglycinamide formyltransferase 1 [Malassezia yamatoensis]|uniref:phosphoribosylglycinamide formyltransferase 1 n=1 Tax=Malassezia yamatoensis TaxID=253288 RepID=A0AAJ5YRS3_9BASI|nr:phosphoribosylglycinamide formyltransferase 1 [Malassezia yamatoensis]
MSEGKSSSRRQRTEALLSRYGGSAGPTGHASVDSDGQPVSLAAFIGGKTKSSRLGHLVGDGRSSPLEATLADETPYRALPGLAKPEGSMAKLMDERHKALFPENSTTEHHDNQGCDERASTTPKDTHHSSSPEENSEKSATKLPSDVSAEDGSLPSKNSTSSDTLHNTKQSECETRDSEATQTLPKRSTSGKRIVVLISGSGSNLQAIIDATCGAKPAIPNAQITTVISNRMNAYGLQRAKLVHPPIPTKIHSLKTFQNKNPGKTRQDYDLVLAEKILGDGPPPDLIVLAGFMHIVSETFLSALGHTTSLKSPPELANRPKHPVSIINLHPAMPGAFDGANAIERAYEAYQNKKIQHTGVMVHEVVAEVDRGAPILVQQVPIYPNQTLDALETKMHQVEHDLLVRAVDKVLNSTYEPSGEPITDNDQAKPVEQHSHREAERQDLVRSEAVKQPTLETVMVFQSPSGILEPLNIFAPEIYLSDLVLAKRGTQTFLWKQKSSTDTLSQAAKKFLGDSYETVFQGAEPQEFTRLLCGPLITRRGHRKQAAKESQMFLLRSTDTGLFVDEVTMTSSSLCSAYSAVILLPSQGFVWHGKGSSREQRVRALQYANTHRKSIQEIDEGDSSASLLDQLRGPYASGWHWRYYKDLPVHMRGARLYVNAKDTQPTAFTSDSLSNDSISILESSLEIYVIIGKQARGDRAEIAHALDRAEELATRIQTTLPDAIPLRPVIHVIVLPSLFPADVQALSRTTWNTVHLEFDAAAQTTNSTPVLLNVYSLKDARNQLTR